MDNQWELLPEQRAEVVHRLTANIASLAFAQGVSMRLEDAENAAETAEKKAYTVASVESRTTSGQRPHAESLRAYTRKLGNLALATVTAIVAVAASGAPAGGAAGGGAAADAHVVLDLSGDREFLTRETAEVALATMFASGSVLTKIASFVATTRRGRIEDTEQLPQIKLSTKSFGREAATVAAQGIANIANTLQEADLSDIIAGWPEDEALSSLRILAAALSAQPNLRTLNLSDNALGEKGVRAFAAGLSNQVALEWVAFQNVGASIMACQAIAELITHPGSLRALQMYNNMSDDAGAAAIAGLLARTPLMADFRMASSRVGAAGGIALAEALATGVALVRLDLSDNPMTAEVAPALGETIRRHPELRVLNLNDTALSDEGVSAIAEALSDSPAEIEDLGLALNEMTPHGMASLAAALCGMTSLQRLNLRENELEDRGALLLGPALAQLGALRELDLCGNQMRRAGAVRIARAVASLPAMERLLLDENEISADGVAQVEAILAAAGKSHVLGSMDENDAEADADDEDYEREDSDDGGLSDALAKQAAIH